MGTTAMVANSTIRLSPGWNAIFYWGVWAISLIGLGIILWAALKSKRWARWTTQDILIVAALGVLLEVYDNIIGDQLIGPLMNPIPGADFSQVHDLPYVFLLLVGVALVRKPGCVTAMVFINFLLAALLFGSGHGVLDWTDGLTQGIFCDLYIVARRGKVFGPSSSPLGMVLDGLAIGILRGGPNAFLGDFTLDPYLNDSFSTWLQTWNDTWSNALFNGIEAAISAVLAKRVAVAVTPSLGIGKARAAAVTPVEPFAEADAGAPATAADAVAAGQAAAGQVGGETSPADRDPP